ncbi:MAG: hypothetical protein WD595_03360 [Waddliaceae bacterium]
MNITFNGIINETERYFAPFTYSHIGRKETNECLESLSIFTKLGEEVQKIDKTLKTENREITRLGENIDWNKKNPKKQKALSILIDIALIIGGIALIALGVAMIVFPVLVAVSLPQPDVIMHAIMMICMAPLTIVFGGVTVGNGVKRLYCDITDRSTRYLEINNYKFGGNFYCPNTQHLEESKSELEIAVHSTRTIYKNLLQGQVNTLKKLNSTLGEIKDRQLEQYEECKTESDRDRLKIKLSAFPAIEIQSAVESKLEEMKGRVKVLEESLGKGPGSPSKSQVQEDSSGSEVKE